MLIDAVKGCLVRDLAGFELELDAYRDDASIWALPTGVNNSAGTLTLHGWHYVIEEGEIHIFDAWQGDFVPAALASNCGTGPYAPYVEHDGQVISF